MSLNKQKSVREQFLQNSLEDFQEALLDATEAWHNAEESSVSLYEYLGFTSKHEIGLFLRDPEELECYLKGIRND